MAVLGVIIVTGPIKIGRHHRDEVGAILPAIGFDELNAGDLGHRVPFVGRLKRSREQHLLAHRLRRQFGVDAGGA